MNLNNRTVTFWEKSLSAWLTIGLLWFLLGLAWSPTDKLYRQGLVLLVWLPAILCLFSQWQLWQDVVAKNRSSIVFIILFLAWATISAFWSAGDDQASDIRRVLYVFLFCSSILYLSHTSPRGSPFHLMTAAAYGVALASLLSILLQYVVGDEPLSTRLSGIGNLEHPILGGYVVGLMLLWLSTNLPHRSVARAFAAAAMASMFLFALFTQSRGLWVALIGTAVIYSFLRGGRRQWLITAALLLFGLGAYWLFGSYVTARGTSFRPEILEESLKMIANNPWLGLGLGAEYDIQAVGFTFSHSHNLFTHVAIEFGLLGLMLWLLIWISGFTAAWNSRHTAEGDALLKVFIFCTIALMFDGGSVVKSPRPEWFLTWLPIALASALKMSQHCKTYQSAAKQCNLHSDAFAS